MKVRSTSIPGIAIGAAGVMATATFIPVANGETCALSVGSMPVDSVVFATNWRQDGHRGTGDVLANNSMSFPINEEWSEEKHKTELRKLILKKATSKAGLSVKDAGRLAALQRMRRDSMPLATSYETFMRERERLAELKRLTDALIEYERKYGCPQNG